VFVRRAAIICGFALLCCAAAAAGCQQVGDASGIQSPLSFGGFGALTRHLHRLQAAVSEALEVRSGWPVDMIEVVAVIAASHASQDHVHGDAATDDFDMLRVSKLARRWMAEVWTGGCMHAAHQAAAAARASACPERRTRRVRAPWRQADALDRDALGAINAYNPGLSSAWMLQRAMSVRPGRPPAPGFVNALLGANFGAMQRRGDAVLKPFLQARGRVGNAPDATLKTPGYLVCAASDFAQTGHAPLSLSFCALETSAPDVSVRCLSTSSIVCHFFFPQADIGMPCALKCARTNPCIASAILHYRDMTPAQLRPRPGLRVTRATPCNARRRRDTWSSSGAFQGAWHADVCSQCIPATCAAAIIQNFTPQTGLTHAAFEPCLLKGGAGVCRLWSRKCMRNAHI